MQEPDNLPEHDSKTQRKKKMLALQDVGKTLVELSASELAQIQLTSPLADAIEVARHLKAREAKRRQLQYIGKLMRNMDVTPITEALERIQLKSQLNTTKLHQVEAWRDKLIQEGDESVQVFLQTFPQADSQPLRQLIRNIDKAKTPLQQSSTQTALFRYLRDIIL